MGNTNGTPPASRTPSHSRVTVWRWARLHGARSLALWAMPMTGRLPCSSPGVRP